MKGSAVDSAYISAVSQYLPASGPASRVTATGVVSSVCGGVVASARTRGLHCPAPGHSLSDNGHRGQSSCRSVRMAPGRNERQDSSLCQETPLSVLFPCPGLGLVVVVVVVVVVLARCYRY